MWHIGRVLAFGGVLAVVVALAGPNDAIAQKKKDKAAPADNGYGATDADYKAIQNRKELSGTIISSTGSVITLRVDSAHVEANPKYKPPKQGAPTYNNTANQLWRTATDLQRQQQQLMTAKNPKTYQQAMQRYYQDLAKYQQQSAQYYTQMMNQYYQATAKTAGGTPADPNYSGPPTADTATAKDPFIVIHAYKEYDLETKDEVVVRKMFLPFEYDDMGKVKTYTDKEKAELRGDDKSKPGYQSKVEEIAKGMEAKLSLTPPPKKKKEDADKDKEKEKDKDAKADDEPVARPTINMVVLTKDAPADAKSPGDAPKKKKDKN